MNCFHAIADHAQTGTVGAHIYNRYIGRKYIHTEPSLCQPSALKRSNIVALSNILQATSLQYYEEF